MCKKMCFPECISVDTKLEWSYCVEATPSYSEEVIYGGEE